MNNFKENHSLEYYANNFNILIDTCSLMLNSQKEYDDLKLFFANISQYLKKKDKKIIISSKVLQELDNKLNSKDKTEKEASKRGHTILKEFEKIIIPWGAESDSAIADQVFLCTIINYAINYNLLIITEDKKLVHDINMLKDLQSVDFYDHRDRKKTKHQIIAKKVGAGGGLIDVKY